MAIAGIEGLAQGFMQGMALKRQNDRQELLDARDAERFSMDKERFATQQAASAFELQNAQTNAANAATDRIRTLRLQSKQDATLANMQKLWSLGDNAEAIHSEVEKLHQANGEQGAYKRDAAGKIITDKSGVATWVNKDGSEVPTDAKGAKMSYWMAANPNEAAKNQLENDNTIAKEDREAKRTIAAEERAAKTAATVAATLHSYRMSEKAHELLAAKLAKADATLDSKDLATFFSVPITVTDADGKIKISQQVNQENFTNYLQWTKKNKVGMTTNSFRDWRAQMPSSGTTDTTASGTDTYDSKSQGKLVAKGLEGEAGAIELNDRQPVSVEKPSAVKSSTDKPATPKSLTVPRPSSSTTPAKTYKGNAGTMLPGDYLAALGVAIKNGMPVMPPPKQYPQGTTFFGNNANPLDQTIKLGTK